MSGFRSSSASSCFLLFELSFESKVECLMDIWFWFDLELFCLVPRVLMHVCKLFLCCFDDSCGIFEKLAVFCHFRVLERFSRPQRRAPLRRGVCLVCTEAGASWEFLGKRAPH